MPRPPRTNEPTLITGKILKWGNSYGIRITRKELEATKLRPGQEVQLRVERHGARNDLSGLPTFRSGVRDTAERHDEVLGDYRYQTRHGRGRVRQ